jgi:hypothetical protein
MTIEQQLEALFNTGDPTLKDIAVRANSLKTALTNGDISQSEFNEMFEDFSHEVNVRTEAHNLEIKEAINTAMNALVTIASNV